MGRGFLSGLIWGGIVGAGMLLVSSQALDRQSLSLPKPEATAVEVPGGTEFDQAREETDPVVPEPDARPEGGATGLADVPEDAVDEAPKFETSALEVPTPSVGEAGGLTDAPETTTPPDAPQVSEEARPEENAADLPLPEAPGAAPDTGGDAPASVAAPAVDDDRTDAPAANDAPSGAEVAALPDAGAEQSGATNSGTAPTVTTEDTAPSAPEAPAVSEEPSLPRVTGDSETAPRLPQVTEPAAPDAAETAPEISTAPEAPSLPDVESDGGSEGEATPSLLEKVDTLEDKAADVETARLPRIGDGTGEDPADAGAADGAGSESDAGSDTAVGTLPTVRRLGDEASSAAEKDEESDSTPGADTEAEADMAGADGPAIRVHGMEFINPEGNPLMALVLVQDSDAAIDADDLAGLPASVAFAIEARRSAAGDLASHYRDAGREIVMIPSLPEGATPQDVEQALRVNLETLPQAVAIMDVTGASFQSDRGAVEQIVDVAGVTGHGVITFPRGLNTAHQSAERAGVPAGLIFRRLDGSGETGEQIRRTLDRAAFRARSDEAIILVGSTAPDTLAAIAEWTSGNRAKSVTLAPISAALLNE